MLGWQRSLGSLLDQGFGALTVLDEIRNRDQWQLVGVREFPEFRVARHRTVFVHDLANHSSRTQPRQAGKVHRRFRMPGTSQYTADLGEQRKDMPRTPQVAGPCIWGHGGLNGAGAVLCGNSRRHSRCRFNRDREVRAVPRSVFRDHQRQVELLNALCVNRHADESASVLGHEIDDLRSDLLRCTTQVALLFAVLVVHHHDQLSPTDRINGVCDGVKSRFQCFHSPLRLCPRMAMRYTVPYTTNAIPKRISPS